MRSIDKMAAMIDDTTQSLPVAETPTNNAADSSQQVGPFTAFDYAGPWTPQSMEDILSWAASGYYFAVIPHAATTLDVDVMEALKTGLRFGVTHYMYCTVLPKDSPAASHRGDGGERRRGKSDESSTS